MMSIKYSMLFILVATSFIDVECQETSGFATPLSVLISTRNTMTRKMKSMARNVDNPNALKSFVQTLKGLKQHAKTFIEAPLTIPESKTTIEMLKSEISKDLAFSEEEALYRSYSLKKDKTERLGMLWSRMTLDIDQFLSEGSKDTHIPALSKVCQGLPLSSLNSMTKDFTKDITIFDVCSGLYSCASVPMPYHWSKFEGLHRARRIIWIGNPEEKYEKVKPGRLPFFTNAPTTPKPKPTENPRFEQNILTACTANKQCNLEKALPMMTGIFWYKISEMIIQRLCSQSCGSESYNHAELYENVMREADLLISYATTLPNYWNSIWNPFYHDAAAQRAFINLDVALSLVKEKTEDFENVGKLCYTLKFEKACPLNDLYTQYTVIRKIQKQRTETSTIKDLRLLAHVDHKQMISLQTEEARHLELLGSIKKLDDNLKVSVSGISEHFQGLARYDIGIAAADVTFIQTELTKYELSLQRVETELGQELKEAMDKMKVVLGANLAEQTAILAVVILSNSNPLKLVFNGPDIKDTMEQSGKVADAADKLKTGLQLIDELNNLQQDSLLLQTAFNGNKQQISSLSSVVKKIREGQSNNIGDDADLFVKEYGDYTPKTDRSQLNRNTALWESFKDAACDLLNGEVGVGGAAAKAIMGGRLLCEKLDGTLAQFITLREDIFDFQFQLVDAIASVVRGNIAQRLAKKIEGKYDSMHARELITGFFMIQNKLQTACAVYCNRLEYQHLGTPDPACSSPDGLFRKENVLGLIKYTDNRAFGRFTRNVLIPTKGTKKYPNHFIDLQTLARGSEEKVVFKIPSDMNWLREHGWIIFPDEDTIPFVESFKLFFPQREYKTGANKVHTTTKVTISSVAGSSVTASTGIVYLLPRDQTVYRSVYEEGYRRCPANEIENPYSLCNNLPKICDNTQRVPGNSLLPTIVSTWSIQHSMSKGGTPRAWDAPNSATNLMLKAKVVLLIPSKSVRKSTIPSIGLQRSDVVMSENGCCTVGNRYIKSEHDHKCYVCPPETTSFLGGLYCQIN